MVLDNRGKSSIRKGKYARKKKFIPEEMSREEFIEYVRATEDKKQWLS